jgi:hypothetical protein
VLRCRRRCTKEVAHVHMHVCVHVCVCVCVCNTWLMKRGSARVTRHICNKVGSCTSMKSGLTAQGPFFLVATFFLFLVA